MEQSFDTREHQNHREKDYIRDDDRFAGEQPSPGVTARKLRF